MSTLSVLQNSFLGGEIAPALYGRIDDKLVGMGAAQITNFMVKPSGALQKRSGFKFVRSFGTGDFRLIPFRFSSDQTLVLIFGNKIMYIATQGMMVMNGNQPYSITTPYSSSEIWELEYSQNADVVTLTSPNVAPYELRRYGATNWEFKKISTLPSLEPPTDVTARPTYPPSATDENTDDMQISSEQRDIITAQYVVTAVDADGVESEASGAAVTKCNYYITGSTVEVSWSAVAGATSYRVYRYVSGVYGFLAQTDQCSISDTGTVPDTSMTPPDHQEAFIGAPSTGEIISIAVTDGGSGYASSDAIDGDGIVYISFLPTLYTTCADRTAGSSETPQQTLKYKVTFTSPEGQSYVGYCAANGMYDNGGDGSTEHAYQGTTSYSKSTGFPIKFSGEAPKPSAGWNVKLEFVWEGEMWACEPRYRPASNTDANLAAHAALSTNDNISKFQAMWSGGGMDASQVVSSLAANSETLELRISGGAGAQAQAIAVNGVITSVRLLSGGRGYSNSSTVTVVAARGSGAKFRVTVGSGTASEFPRASGQFDQRRVFAGSLKNPLKVWMTNPGKQSLMMTHTPIQDDDRIEIVAVASDADMIRHIVGMESLILLTGSSELRVLSMNSDRLSPSTIGVRTQAYNGSNNVKPVTVNNTIVFISSRGGHPKMLTYSNNSQSYSAVDLGIRCPHLFDNKNVLDMTLSKAPYSNLYCVSTDGTLYCATFIPEQNINAWMRFTVGDEVESVCAVSEGAEDHVYIIVRRNGQACLERMSDLVYNIDTDARIMDSFLDAAFTSPQTEITGLNHLEGRTVAVHVDGKYQGTQTVVNGAVTLSPAGRVVAIGLPITSSVITIPFEYSNPKLVYHERNPTDMYVRFNGSGNMLAGIYPRHKSEHLYPQDLRNSKLMVQNPESRVVPIKVSGNWDNQSQLELRSNDTLPLELLGVLVDGSWNRSSR